MRAIHLSSAFLLVLATINFGVSTVTATSCADRVSSGDKSLGITAVEDASCANGGLGCFPDGDQCRFCRPSNATDSENAHLMQCSEVQVSAVSASSESGSKTTTSTTNSETSDSHEAAIDCLSLVSPGDLGVGISAVAPTNPTCSANGLGCFNEGKCRFCQSRQTTQSAPYMKCSLVGGSTTSSTPSTATMTPSTAYTPAPSVASTSTSCSSVVSRSGLQGISFISDSRCNVASPTLLGCSARTSCRLCRDYKNEANQYLISCQVLKDLGTTESATATTESVAAEDQTSGKLDVTTEAAGTEVASTPGVSAGFIGAVAAVVAVLVAVMMSVMYVKGQRDPLDDIRTPDDCPDGDLMTPHSGRGYTPREGSLVMVVSQSSIATL